MVVSAFLDFPNDFNSHHLAIRDYFWGFGIQLARELVLLLLATLKSIFKVEESLKIINSSAKSSAAFCALQSVNTRGIN